jgi:predicted GIY-YIG superfamily endonuclease
MKHVRRALQANGYSTADINRATRNNSNNRPSDTTPTSKAFLPYIKHTTDRIAKVLRKKEIVTTFTATTKLGQLTANFKDRLDPLSVPGIYKVPCDCGSVYIGMTGRSVKQRITEHERDLRLKHPDRSAVAEHALEHKHTIQFDQAEVIARVTGFYNLQRREAIEIIQHPTNYNREEGFHLSRTWRTLLRNKQANHDPSPLYAQSHI